MFRQVDALRKPSTRDAVNTALTIKRERVEQEEVSKKARIWAAELKASNSTIDLDSPTAPSQLSRLVPSPVQDTNDDDRDAASEEEEDVPGPWLRPR